MTEDARERLLDAALGHVPFEGWSEATFRAAVRETGVEPALARALCPRGAVDLAVAFHRRGDARMAERLASADLGAMRFRDKVAFAVRARIEAVEDREVVRRGTALFALPTHAADGARLIWGTADLIWKSLGDTSEDVNWYTKRATLSGVYASTVLYWLGDDSLGHQATWEFLDRRIENVMQFEKLKTKVREAPVIGRLLTDADRVLSRIRAPRPQGDTPMPGRWDQGG